MCCGTTCTAVSGINSGPSKGWPTSFSGCSPSFPPSKGGREIERIQGTRLKIEPGWSSGQVHCVVFSVKRKLLQWLSLRGHLREQKCKQKQENLQWDVLRYWGYPALFYRRKCTLLSGLKVGVENTLAVIHAILTLKANEDVAVP